MNLKDNMFVGTYILDTSGNVVPKITTRVNKDARRLEAFTSLFKPIQQKLPVSKNEGNDVGILFWLFASFSEFDNAHTYLKTATYAYSQLIAHTNILETGKVRFVIDKPCRQIATPYLQATGLESLIITNDDSHPLHRNYTGYLPFITFGLLGLPVCLQV